jgi:hypothetical protein
MTNDWPEPDQPQPPPPEDLLTDEASGGMAGLPPHLYKVPGAVESMRHADIAAMIVQAQAKVPGAIAALPNAPDAVKTNLLGLTTQLCEALKQVPPEHDKMAVKMLSRMQAAITEVGKPLPDSGLIMFCLRSLAHAAVQVDWGILHIRDIAYAIVNELYDVALMNPNFDAADRDED